MLKITLVTITFYTTISIAFCQQPFSWFAEPFTEGFSYMDGEGEEQRSSIWEPRLLQFFVDDGYSSGAFLTSSSFNIDNWEDVGGFQVLQNRLHIGSDKLNLSDNNGVRTFIDVNGYTLKNNAGFQTVKLYSDDPNGQIDLMSGRNNRWIARLGATAPGSDRGSMT